MILNLEFTADYTTREELVTVIKPSASGSVLEQIP